MNTSSKWAVALLVTAGVAAASQVSSAYTTYGKWGTTSVSFFVNPANVDVSTSAAVSALQAGMDTWNTNSGTPFRFSYAGQVSDTSTGYDNRNVIIFRNVSNGSAIASTYSWSSNGNLVDSDIVFWDGGFRFFTGSSGCSNGAYIEDIATHELGHAMGLQHSTYTNATMYPSYSTCSMTQRTIEPDDIAGAQSLYNSGSTTTTTNNQPTVSITSPVGGSSIASGTATTFTGSATDVEDGNITASLKWTSSIEGSLGTGSGFTRTLTAGTHTITATVTDKGGKTTARAINVTVSASSSTATTTTTTTTNTTGPTLTAAGSKVKGLQQTSLRWSGLTATSVDVLRNGSKVTTTANDGSHLDAINSKGGGTYTYQVCAAGTSTCTPRASVTF